MFISFSHARDGTGNSTDIYIISAKISLRSEGHSVIFLVVTRSGSEILSIENLDKKQVSIYHTTILWTNLSTESLCIRWSYTFNLFPFFSLQAPCQWMGIFFFWLVSIASEWVSHQSCSLPSRQIKAKTAYHFLSLTRCLLVASVNYESVLLGLFFPSDSF